MCAICKNELIVESSDPTDDPSIIGDEAHIIARKESFTRGDYDSLTSEQRDHYPNLILLCKTHHKQIDDQPAFYTVERLREIKNTHEKEVKANRTETDKKRQRDDIIYSGYIDEWQRRAGLDNWRSTSSWLSADTPTLPKAWYNNQKEFLIWIIGRIWPGRYTSIEKALLNYKKVLQDFLNVFDRHIDYDQKETEFLRTKKFYKINEYDAERYDRLLKQYEAHVCLVNDLFFELTRAANYICDKVRDMLFGGYRIQEGALLIERHNVGLEMNNVHVRVEYRGDECTEMPYPGLKKFKEVRYKTRDYALDPGDPELTENDDESA
ncbi:MAG: HNH endonuclease signature motif containing protein [bacterium]|nr:HNH endonuclease signature motif containing protein [bacterium]